jgi:hypothetical protein
MITLIKYPKRRAGLIRAAVFSLAVHALLALVIYTYPLVKIAMGLSGIEYVDEEYDRVILIDFSKRLQYPPGYLGFRPPVKTRSLEEIKKEEERRARREEERRRRQIEREKREREEALKREAEEKIKADDLAKASAPAAPTPTPAPKNDGYPGGFGKINTAPIKDQIQRLYEAKKAGKLVIPDGKFKVGVAGSIKPDGTLADYRIIIPSGIKEIDDAAMAILEAVSVSRALTPLHNLTSLSMILDIDNVAQLNVVGFTSNEQDARAIVDLANTALLFAKIKKSDDPAAMVMLNNLKVTRTGQRIHAVISVPRQTAADTLNKSLSKGQG